MCVCTHQLNIHEGRGDEPKKRQQSRDRFVWSVDDANGGTQRSLPINTTEKRKKEEMYQQICSGRKTRRRHGGQWTWNMPMSKIPTWFIFEPIFFYGRERAISLHPSISILGGEEKKNFFFLLSSPALLNLSLPFNADYGVSRLQITANSLSRDVPLTFSCFFLFPRKKKILARNTHTPREQW